MDIKNVFGARIKELRARSGISQELLAHLSQLDRTYISGVERGERNISLVNIERIAAALSVSVAYLFSEERFSSTPAYQQKDFAAPFTDRFKYNMDSINQILSIQLNGLLTGNEMDQITATILGVCTSVRVRELNVLVDQRKMRTADGEAAVYSPVVAEKSILLQQRLQTYSKKAIVLCNSEYMFYQQIYVTKRSGFYELTTPLFDDDRKMVQDAYRLLGVHGNDLIQ